MICLDGERRRSFASRWEVEAKCLSRLSCLLELFFQRKSTVHRAFLLLHCFVEVSLNGGRNTIQKQLLLDDYSGIVEEHARACILVAGVRMDMDGIAMEHIGCVYSKISLFKLHYLFITSNFFIYGALNIGK
jgi:hypothetical protein